MFGKILRLSLLLLVLTALLWGGVVIWWQETSRLVTPQDVALYLIAVPLAVIGGFFLLRAGLRLATRPGEAAAAGPATAPGAGNTASAADPVERGYALALLAAGVSSAAGAAAGELMTGLKAGKLKPAGDPELKDDDGFPVRTGRAQACDPAPIAAWYDAYGPRLAVAPPAGHAPESLMRALALLEAPLTECVETLAPLLPLAPDGAAAGAPSVPPQLRLALLLPDTWDEGTRNAAQAFVAERIAALDWPADRLAIALPAAGVSTLDIIESFRLGANRAATPELLLLAACDSLVTEAAIDRLGSQGRLYRSDNQQGLVPGEAAAALLLCAPARVPQGLAPVALVQRASRGVREKSADDGGRVQPDLLCALAAEALVAAGVEAKALAAVVSDTDHRSSRTAEAAGMMTRLTPELDPVADRLSVGDGLGDVGTAGLPILLALAAHSAAGADKPALAITLSDARECAAMVVRPPTRDAAADAAQPT